MAQLIQHLPRTQKIAGSSPAQGSSSLKEELSSGVVVIFCKLLRLLACSTSFPSLSCGVVSLFWTSQDIPEDHSYSPSSGPNYVHHFHRVESQFNTLLNMYMYFTEVTQDPPKLSPYTYTPHTIILSILILRILSIPGYSGSSLVVPPYIHATYLVFRTLGMWCVCMGGQLGRLLSTPGYLVFRTLGTSQVSLAFWLLGMWCVCVGGQLGRILCDLSKVHVHI